ncbi:hypothetical protein IWQ60_000607 [Tieghemiomyces parasiticus]|uniref:Uncharacterized protein n=1 Tax=Tieghemiomyces parasiticus TaxID=78921 RepID=A0A9W8AMD4_9FUNG|nr:hypothetical protein IWQ60_000607 [Tieghemiomyces parasiticus]
MKPEAPSNRTAFSSAAWVRHYGYECDRLARMLFIDYAMVLEPTPYSRGLTEASAEVPQYYRVVECEFYIQDDVSGQWQGQPDGQGERSRTPESTVSRRRQRRQRQFGGNLDPVVEPGDPPTIGYAGFWDPFAHGHALQDQPGRYYFHHVGQSTGYREGTRRGVDITLGYTAEGRRDVGVRAGVLIRTIQNLRTGELVSGPCLVVNTVLDHFGVPNVRSLVDSVLQGDLAVYPSAVKAPRVSPYFGRGRGRQRSAARATTSANLSRAASPPERRWYFATYADIHERHGFIPAVPTEESVTMPPLITPRVGLALNPAKCHLDAQWQYLFQPLRYVNPAAVAPAAITKGRAYTVLGELERRLVDLAVRELGAPADTPPELFWWWMLGFELPTHVAATKETGPDGYPPLPAEYWPRTYLLPNDALHRYRTLLLPKDERQNPLSPQQRPPTPPVQWLVPTPDPTGLPNTAVARVVDTIRAGSQRSPSEFLATPLGNHTLIYQCFGAYQRYIYNRTLG